MTLRVALIAILFGISLFADIKLKTYEEAIKEAQATNKIVALTIVSSSCPWCHKLLRETIKDKSIESALNKDFVYVTINKDITALPNGIVARLVPTTFFLDKDGQKLIPPAIGFWNAEDFGSYLSDALKKSKK